MMLLTEESSVVEVDARISTAQLASSFSRAQVSSPMQEAHVLLTLKSSFRGEECGAQQGEMRSVLTLSN